MAKGYYRGSRKQLTKAKQFHLLLSVDDLVKLQALTHAMKASAADVVRSLIREAKV